MTENNTPVGTVTPSITAAQVVAGISAIIGLLVTDQWIDGRIGKLITGIASIVIPMTWVFADAHIRHGRAIMRGKIESAKIMSGRI